MVEELKVEAEVEEEAKFTLSSTSARLVEASIMTPELSVIPSISTSS